MKMRRQSALYLDSSVDSIILAIELYNRPSPVGRAHAVPILLGHAFELLLKSVIFQRRGSVRDKGDELTYSLSRCIAIAADDIQVITKDERAVLATIKQDRDAAAHDTIAMSEAMLLLRMKMSIGLIRRLLRDEFEVDLASRMPSRTFPVSVDPPQDLSQMVADELTSVRKLLAPNTRRGPEARAYLRPLLSLDAAATGRTDPPTESEVGRAERKLREGTDWRLVLPGLATMSIAPVEPGQDAREVVLRVGKDADALPVRRAHPEEEALAYRSVDPFVEFGGKLTEFGQKLGITRQQGYALIAHLALKEDDRAYFCRRTKNGNIQYQGLGARAYELGRRALESGIDVAELTRQYNTSLRTGGSGP